jgi:hypothetical protein
VVCREKGLCRASYEMTNGMLDSRGCSRQRHHIWHNTCGRSTTQELSQDSCNTLSPELFLLLPPWSSRMFWIGRRFNRFGHSAERFYRTRQSTTRMASQTVSATALSSTNDRRQGQDSESKRSNEEARNVCFGIPMLTGGCWILHFVRQYDWLVGFASLRRFHHSIRV